MKLLILYGPPAVGKLTVAREIERRTVFKVFHNHLSIDCVEPVFDFGTKPFVRLIEMIRCETIAEAAREGVSLIHTFVYAQGPDDSFFEKLISSAEDNGGEVCLVLLRCDREEGKQRVTAEHRSRMRKVATPEMLDSLYEEYELREPLPGRETLIVDNTDLSVEATATRIIEHFRLKEV